MQSQVGFKSLISGFIESVDRFPTRTAIEVSGSSLTYEQLGHRISDLAETIKANDDSASALIAVLAHRSLTAYVAVLGALAAGKGYVPLNPKFPPKRLRTMLYRSGASTIIVGLEAYPILERLLENTEHPFTLILPDATESGYLPAGCANHQVIRLKGMERGSTVPEVPQVSPEYVAYLMFTSGSTGEPKGVPVSQSNVMQYVRYVCDRYKVNERDRFSQMFDLTFDLSVHDMFVCWQRGACLYCPTESEVMAPAKFIRDNHLTMWFSVPSTIGLTQKFGLLRDGAFPSLRVSLFCGEALPAAYADAWHRAASSSVVENLYGPTEATISITHYTWDDDKSPGMCLNGIVPIGTTFEGQEICIIDSKRHVLPVGEMGELCLAGSQVTAGYWKTPKKTGEQYITIPSKGNSIWYRTGDLAKNDAEGCLYYLGRIDNQVKVRGYRVELGEVEYQVRQASDREEVVAIAWPTNDGSAQGIVAFIEGQCHLEKQSIIERCSEFLPDYMVPRNIYFLEALPRNANGKLDRRKLYSFLEKGD